jgi:hypothetical protein
MNVSRKNSLRFFPEKQALKKLRINHYLIAIFHFTIRYCELINEKQRASECLLSRFSSQVERIFYSERCHETNGLRGP